ncbi:MAG TPA: hypothetical protein VF071_10645, partial [Candidatus Limnocylindria bacterium]
MAVVLALAGPNGTAGAQEAGATPTRPARESDLQRIEGAIVRGPVEHRRLALVFTGHEFAEGAPVILEAL